LAYRATDLAQSAVRLTRPTFAALEAGMASSSTDDKKTRFGVAVWSIAFTFLARFGMPPSEWRHDCVKKL